MRSRPPAGRVLGQSSGLALPRQSQEAEPVQGQGHGMVGLWLVTVGAAEESAPPPGSEDTP